MHTPEPAHDSHPGSTAPSRPLLIGMDAKRAYNNATGLGNYSRSLIRSLMHNAPNNWRYVLYTPKIKPAWADFVKDERVQTILPKGMMRWFSGLWRSTRISKLVYQHKLDIYHGLSAELPVNMEKSRVKTVVTIHDLIYEIFPEHYKAVDRRIYRRKTMHASSAADLVICTSAHTRDDLCSRYGISPQKVRVIYQDAGDLFYRQPATGEITALRSRYNLPETYLLCVSAFQERKNHMTLLKAYSLLEADRPHLVLAGKPGSTLEKVRTYIRQANLEQSVTVLTDIPGDQLPALYKGALLALQPSLYEGFGIPVVEALRMGVPQLLSNSSCFPEVGGNAALYAHPGDAESWAAQLTLLYRDPVARERLVSAISSQLMLFDRERLIEKMVQVYHDLSHAD